ncbi:MAG TPA: J domain-containing protein [Polyangiaceae bacterium]|nr:J domain-containing protein [Polyangiaceae bacterium]
MADLQPTAAGTLQATPLPHLLVYVLDRQLDGSLVLEAPDGGRSAILLEAGSPAKAKTAEPVIHLGRLLLEMGLIDEATHNRTLAEVAQTKQLHGQILIRENAIDNETLRAALREQIARQVLWLFNLPPDTAYGYYADVNFLERWGALETTRVQPLGLLWRGIRAHADDARVADTLARLGSAPLHLHPDGQIGRFNMEPAEQAAIDVLRVKPQGVEELSLTGLMPAATLKRLIYALAITRHLDRGVPGAAPVGVDEAPSSSRIAIFEGAAEVRRRRRLSSRRPKLTAPAEPAAPEPPPGGVVAPAVKLSPELLAFMQEIRELTENMSGQNYYEILGIPIDAPKAAIQGAFFQLAKRWHPDRVSNQVGDLKPDATRIFSRMSEAHQVLSDERLRAEYNEVVKEGGASAGEQDEIQAVLRAATAFQKAEVFLKRNNLTSAEEHARIAIENDASQADYVALYTWIQAQKSDLDGQTLEQLITRLDTAVNAEPENPRSRWYRGQLLKRAGSYDAAMKDFRFIAERDPKHLDATREIRLYEMRRSALRNTPTARPTSSPPPRHSGSMAPPRRPSSPPDKKTAINKDLGGLIGKWFKR